VLVIIRELFELQDIQYKSFHSKLIPDIDPDTIIGIRVPDLRKLAKSIKNNSEINLFKSDLPHKYYEENNLHAFLICEIEDFDLCIQELNKFLPFVDNWATCDSLRPKCFKSNKDKLLKSIKEWINSEDTYTVRFAIEMLMTHFLDAEFSCDFHNCILNVKSEEYYIKMMVAWYFATALAKQWDSTIKILEQKILPVWTHNKTIQKAVESYRITDIQKLYLRTLKK